MPDNLQEMLRDALLNNTYDHESTHLALKMAWENSFSYLYRMQLEKVGYEEYHYYSNDTTAKNPHTIGHFYLDDHIRACFDIDKDIIHVCDRMEFRLSNYYHRYFTLQEMVDDGQIFQYIPIVIIDDQVVWDWEMRVISKDAVQFRMPKPFRRQFVLKNERDPITDELIYVDHKVQVLIVDNVYYERFVLNKMGLYLDSSGKSFSIKKTRMGHLPLEVKEGIYFATISFPSDGNQEAYLCTQLIDLYESESGLTGYLSDDLWDKINRDVNDMWISVVYVNELHRKTWYTGLDFTQVVGRRTDMMVLNRDGDFVPYASPVPVERFIVFRTRKNESVPKLLPNTKTIRMYYPNIYQIIDKDMQDMDTYKVFYFYHYNTSLKYTCLYEFWFRWLKLHFANQDENMSIEEIIDRIMRGRFTYDGWSVNQRADFITTFEKILGYTYKRHTYAEMDFLYNWVTPMDQNPATVNTYNGEAFQYKEAKLKEWIRNDPWLLRDYVLEQKKVGAIYHLFTNTLDLSTRYRTSTDLELKYHYVFDEPMYVFAMRNEREYPVLMDIRFFVDGIFIENMYQDRYLFMDYLYIPVRMVTEDSYIEMEVFPRYDFSTPLRFESMDDVKTITVAEPEEGDIWPTNADAYVMLRSGEKDEYTHLYENSLNEFFKVTECYKEGEWEVKTTNPDKPVLFTRLRTLKLQPNDPSVLNLDMDLRINKHPIGLPYRITQAGYPYLQLVGAENKFHYHADYIRVYRNGRLLPNVKWCFYSSFECPRIQLLEWFDVNDTIYFDITPFRYKMVYYKEELEPGQLLVDLKDAITKPFDWRYYDVYMNGRRLSMNNLFAITPWEITMVNLNSNYNLAIYEKERDWEYYGLNYKEPMYFFLPTDLKNHSWVSEEEMNQLIKDMIDAMKDERLNIYPNENWEIKQDWEDKRQYVLLMAFYFNELMPKTYVNPSVLQFNKRIIEEEYPIVYDTYMRTGIQDARNPIEEELRKDNPEALLIDPDILFNGENEENLTYVYVVGHTDTVPQEYLDSTISIDDDSNKLGGA